MQRPLTTGTTVSAHGGVRPLRLSRNTVQVNLRATSFRGTRLVAQKRRIRFGFDLEAFHRPVPPERRHKAPKSKPLSNNPFSVKRLVKKPTLNASLPTL